MGEQPTLGAQTSVAVGMGQIRVVPGDVAGNLDRIHAVARLARENNCDVLVLPECADVGWMDPSAIANAEPLTGRRVSRLRGIAEQFEIAMVVGVTEKDEARVYNTAVYIERDGQLLQRHRKINELDVARSVYSTGREIAAFECSLGVVAINVCADNYADSLDIARAQISLGAQLILSPSSWAVPPDHDNQLNPYGKNWEDPYRSIALGRGTPVVGVSNVGPITGGPWSGWQCIGCSVAVDKYGDVVVRSDYGPDAADFRVVQLDLGNVAGPVVPAPPKPPGNSDS